MKTVGRIIRWLAQGAAMLGALAVVLMMIQVTLDVALKNLFAYPIPFTATLVTKWYMVAAAFLPLGLTEIYDRHIAVELAYQKFPRSWRRIAGAGVCLLTVAVILTVIPPLWHEAVEKYAVGSFIRENGRELSVWQTYFFLPLGFAVFGLVVAWRALAMITGRDSGMGEVPFEPETGGLPPELREGI